LAQLRLAVLISGTGRTLQNLIRRSAAGAMPATCVLVVSSSRDAKGIDRATAAGIPVLVVERGAFPTQESFEAAITAALDGVAPDLVVMAGFLKRWRPAPRYRGRTINIHPALLPLFGGKGFYGHHVHEAVVASGMKVTGCTVHFVTDEYDAGPILLQRTVEVRFEDTPDTIAAKVFELECDALPEAIALIAAGRVTIEGRRVRIAADTGGAAAGPAGETRA
jgi:formyltetrahydrofolate-dependent phosphoribosylglycinamide formyltransferase